MGLHLALSKNIPLVVQEIASKHLFLKEVLPCGVLYEAPSPSRLISASQQLPHTALLEGNSIRELSLALFEWIAALEVGETSLLTLLSPVDGALSRRASLLYQEFTETLKKKRRSLLRKMTAVENEPSSLLFQIRILSPTQLAVSLSPHQDGVTSGFPDGIPPVTLDQLPPSRAYLKLQEATLLYPPLLQKDTSVVELGASPGGWTYIAVEKGCSVIALDRSPLEDSLMKHKKVTFISGDAFRYTPEKKVATLLSDLACSPERALELILHWGEKKLSDHFCVTFKFTGTPQLDFLLRAEIELEKITLYWQIIQLQANKNEVTAIGTYR